MLGLRCHAWFSLAGTSRGATLHCGTLASLVVVSFSSFKFYFKISFLIQDKLHYNVVLVSVIDQHESAISVPVYSRS